MHTHSDYIPCLSRLSKFNQPRLRRARHAMRKNDQEIGEKILLAQPLGREDKDCAVWIKYMKKLECLEQETKG